MPAIVTDQFRILNAGNFVDSITDDANSYYVFVGLSNATSTGQYKKGDWDDKTPNPVDNFDYHGFISDNMSYGKRITSANVKRLAKRYNWTRGAKYEMYRHDYSVDNKTSSGLNRLYDSKYYVMNSDYKVYICIDMELQDYRLHLMHL